MARKTRLTTEIIEAIADGVRRGAFPYIAAQAAGIPKSTFYGWMARGENGRKPFSELRDKVRTAEAEARSDAEARVYREKPLEWLRLGPGRTQPDEPGWTDFKGAGDTLVNLSVNASAGAIGHNPTSLVPMDEHGREIPSSADVVESMRILNEMGFLPSMAGAADRLYGKDFDPRDSNVVDATD